MQIYTSHKKKDSTTYCNPRKLKYPFVSIRRAEIRRDEELLLMVPSEDLSRQISPMRPKMPLEAPTMIESVSRKQMVVPAMPPRMYVVRKAKLPSTASASGAMVSRA